MLDGARNRGAPGDGAAPEPPRDVLAAAREEMAQARRAYLAAAAEQRAAAPVGRRLSRLARGVAWLSAPALVIAIAFGLPFSFILLAAAAPLGASVAIMTGSRPTAAYIDAARRKRLLIDDMIEAHARLRTLDGDRPFILFLRPFDVARAKRPDAISPHSGRIASGRRTLGPDLAIEAAVRHYHTRRRSFLALATPVPELKPVFTRIGSATADWRGLLEFLAARAARIIIVFDGAQGEAGAPEAQLIRARDYGDKTLQVLCGAIEAPPLGARWTERWEARPKSLKTLPEGFLPTPWPVL